MAPAHPTIRSYCLSILESGDLATKLSPPPGGLRLSDAEPGPARIFDAPARDADLVMKDGSDKLPRPGKMREVTNRILCLERFAHHELQAVELFAWALLAFPDLPSSLRRGWLQVLTEEQDHCRLYINHLEKLGGSFGGTPLSNYFWKSIPVVLEAENPPLAFLCTMGLTLEQANLDFSLLYRDAFREAGDEEGALALQKVHDDEVGHVKVAKVWLERLSEQPSDILAYETHVPFPFGVLRAKGKRFDVSARRKAGLSEDFIKVVRNATKKPRQ